MKYTVSAEVTISVFTEVEASSPKEALTEAEGRQMMGLCHYCAGSHGSHEEWVTGGELDGDPVNIRVEES